MKLWDLHIAKRPLPRVGQFLLFWINPLLWVYRSSGSERSRGTRIECICLARSLAYALVGAVAGWKLYGADSLRSNLFLSQILQLVVFYLTVFGVLDAVTAIIRLLGGSARIAFENFFFAATPAEFWRRYNRVTGQFLFEDVFRPLGGRRAPLRGTLFAFAFSALLHEYVFSIGAGHIQGFQTTFFLLHGLASAMTLRVRLRGVHRLWGIGLTSAFAYATSFLFFASWQELLPGLWWSGSAIHGH
jgi:hypothetical protein